MLYGKNVVLGVSGGIAVYKACEIVSRLKKLGANVDVIMTDHATEFVTPLTFQTLAKSAVVTNPFEPVKEFDINHISLAKKADVFLVAPATANVIAKFAQGIADDMLSTTYLATTAHKIVCPAMNVNMYEDAQTQENMRILRERGVEFVDSTVGLLACGDVGKGRMAEPVDIVKAVENYLTPNQDFADKTVLITAGGTEESIDGVRVLTNRSSGKMGVALCQAVADRGGRVLFVHANMSVPAPTNAETVVKVKTTDEMLSACEKLANEADVYIFAAAPADFKLKNKFENKLKGDTLTLDFVKNPDIARTLGEKKGDRKSVIFCAETENLISSAKEKLVVKNADLVVANDVSRKDVGFEVDENEVVIIDRSGKELASGKLSKRKLADVILDKILLL
ncbi:MAG: bifunctional phosphopantothenoylcysteine decarboxylase/phosphopantothenate--cysteine ligase CoaBC [Clostridia bacterium]|nr:bifunctional phosphopantothenoylcysteine decarboxylase/phosphopantothenate--cysteine ligase CoaBC [Clostridia bacterium]